MNLLPEGIKIGILLFRWNGLLIAFGILAGGGLSAFLARRCRAHADVLYGLFLTTPLLGFLFARLWHVFTPPLSSVQLGLTTAHYLAYPLDTLAFSVGGYGIPGAWLGAGLALWWMSTQGETSIWEMGDWLAPGAALAQAIGRVGDLFNQQHYGLPTELPWGIYIAPQNRLAGWESASYFHPLFAYESALNLLLLIFLLWLSRRARTPGGVLLSYLMFYSAARFALEFLRLDVALAYGVNINQVFFALAFLLALVLFIARAQKTIPLWRDAKL